jgi:hypothetical protein
MSPLLNSNSTPDIVIHRHAQPSKPVDPVRVQIRERTADSDRE